MTPLIRNAADELVEAYPVEEEDITLYLPGWTARDLLGWKSGQEITAIPEILDLEIVIKKGAKNIERLILSNTNIIEISGLEYFPNLKDLDLNRCQITKITGLENLTKLKKLDLSDNNITEITGLDCLLNLEVLNLMGGQITKITGLENLTKLKDLDLSFNQITEILGLETLTQLKRLRLYENQITEIAGLETLTQLQELNLGANQITQIKGLETLTNLSYIALANRYLLTHKIYEEDLLQGYPAAQKCVQYCIKIKNIKSILSKGHILLEEDDLSVFMKQATMEEINFFIQSPKTHPDNIRLLKNEAMRRIMDLKNGLNIYR